MPHLFSPCFRPLKSSATKLIIFYRETVRAIYRCLFFKNSSLAKMVIEFLFSRKRILLMISLAITGFVRVWFFQRIISSLNRIEPTYSTLLFSSSFPLSGCIVDVEAFRKLLQT